MTRTAALRASVFFMFLTIIFGAVNFGSPAPAAEAIFLVTGALFLVTMLFALSPLPTHTTVPARVHRRTTWR